MLEHGPALVRQLHRQGLDCVLTASALSSPLHVLGLQGAHVQLQAPLVQYLRQELHSLRVLSYVFSDVSIVYKPSNML